MQLAINLDEELVLNFKLVWTLLGELFAVVDHIVALFRANTRQFVQDFGVVSSSYAEHAKFWRNFSLVELLLDLFRYNSGAPCVSVSSVRQEEDQ